MNESLHDIRSCDSEKEIQLHFLRPSHSLIFIPFFISIKSNVSLNRNIKNIIVSFFLITTTFFQYQRSYKTEDVLLAADYSINVTTFTIIFNVNILFLASFFFFTEQSFWNDFHYKAICQAVVTVREMPNVLKIIPRGIHYVFVANISQFKRRRMLNAWPPRMNAGEGNCNAHLFVILHYRLKEMRILEEENI